jgi:hypothetical protein
MNNTNMNVSLFPDQISSENESPNYRLSNLPQQCDQYLVPMERISTSTLESPDRYSENDSHELYVRNNCKASHLLSDLHLQ